MTDTTLKERYTGCLLGGAVGDALGWPVEFSSIREIIRDYGKKGILDPPLGAAGVAEITDDTQMTLFTAEGLLSAWTSARQSGNTPDFINAMRRSYGSWLITQGEISPCLAEGERTGWLQDIAALHQRRAPGSTCLSALKEDSLSSDGIARNTSKGCGGVMRAAPAGLLTPRIYQGSDQDAVRHAFELGRAAAALTHGHPSGYYPAGALAAIIATVVTGGTLLEGANLSLKLLKNRSGAKETSAAIKSALMLWENQDLPASPDVISCMGEGWVGEEALAIGLYCALDAGDDFVRGVRLAVNHSGDSDSTGSITGNLLGALLGEKAIPSAWLARLEVCDVIRKVGAELFEQ